MRSRRKPLLAAPGCNASPNGGSCGISRARAREFRIGSETVIKPETFYFTGRRGRRGETCLTLLMLDVDAHKVGNLENAMEFARRLKDRFLPGCYVETSTNGNGAHVFLIVDKTDWADPEYNAVLRELDRWLKAVLAETGIELDTVEVKGTCATVSWKDGMPKHVAGTLAKLPREWERFEELRRSPSTPPISFWRWSRRIRSRRSMLPRRRRCASRGVFLVAGSFPRESKAGQRRRNGCCLWLSM